MRRGFWSQVAEVIRWELRLLRAHRKLALACAGLVLVPALYAWIYLFAMWDPAAHTRDLPAGLVSLDEGARYRDRDLNLGRQVLEQIERQGQFAYRRYDDPAQARSDVRSGRIAFVLEIPADFSRRALPGEHPGAAKLSIYTSEGNNFASAEFARRFAPEVARRVNTMLAEARWDLVLSRASGSQQTLEDLRKALGELYRGADELHTGLTRAREGGQQLSSNSAAAVEAATRLRAGAAQLAEGTQQLGGGVRQMGSSLRAIEARRPPEAELAALRLGLAAQVDGQRELLRGLEGLLDGSRQLQGGLGQFREAADDVPLFGGRLVEGLAPLTQGAQQLGTGLDQARAGQVRLLQGAVRLQEGVGALADGSQRAGQAVSALTGRLPEDGRVESLADGARELVRGHDALLSGLQQFGGGTQSMQIGLSRLNDGAGRLETGLELVRRSLPQEVDRPAGSAQGLAQSVEPVVEVVAPVPNQGSALTPNFVPLALWVGAVMVAFIVHLRRIPEPLADYPRLALAAGKLALPLAIVLLQSLVMLLMLAQLLHVPLPELGQFTLLLATTSVAFLALVWALVRLLGDIGKVVAVLLLIVQVSAAGALLPIQLSDEAFQAMHPYLPLTWVVQAFRASLFGAFDGAFWPAYQVVAGIAGVCLVLGAVAGRWRPVPAEAWRPPLDMD
ncbi:MAG: YhgE/Pip family protein [Rubrivivax sp.]